jgi:ferritin-like metal-binding protein YciE
MANSLLQQGLGYTQLGDQATAQVMQTQLAQETALQNAIAKFAGGLAGAKTS